MKHNHFDMLPIRAFSPRSGSRMTSFGMGMALEGGGGGDVFSGITDAVSNVVDSVGQAVSDVAQSVSDVGVQIDKSVNNAIPGGWATVGAVVATICTMGAAAPALAVEGAAEAGVIATEVAADGAMAAEAAGATEAGMAAAETGATAAAQAGAETAVAAGESTSVAVDIGSTTAEMVGPSAEMVGGADVAAADAAAQQAALEQFGQQVGTGALKSAGMNAANQLVSTGSIDPNKVLNAGLTGAVMGGASGALTSAGVNPLIANTVAGSAAGGTNAALNGGNVGRGLLVGGAGGAASGAANVAGQAMNLDPISQGALSGAVRGSTMSALNNSSIGTGALTGAVVGGASSAGNQLGTGIQNAATDGTSNNTLLGQVLGGAAGYEAKSLMSPASTQPAAHMVGALPKTSATGAPVSTQPNSSVTAGGSTGMPGPASSYNGTSQVALPGGNAGVPLASSPNANTGSASNLYPTSGLNSAGLPAQLTPGVLTSSAVPESQDNTAQMDQLKQLYPQLSNVDPRILSSLVSSPVTMKEGGIVRMASGGSPQYEAVQQLVGIPQVRESAAEQAAYGNPTGGHRRPLAATHFINGRKDGGGIHSLEYGAHVPEFVTGKTGHYVKGKGDGQSDDIPAMLADGEYVFDADTVASLGNGSSDAGSKVLDKMREEIRKHKRSASPKEIPPKAKSPLEYMKGKK